MGYFRAPRWYSLDTYPVLALHPGHRLRLSTSHVSLCAAGKPSFSILGLPWIVHSRSTVKVSPSIILSGLRMLRQISIEFVVRLSAILLKKLSLWSTSEPMLMSNMNQLLSTISCLTVMEVPMPCRMRWTLHVWASLPVYTVTGVPILGCHVSGKDCLGIEAIFSSKEFKGGWLVLFGVSTSWFGYSLYSGPLIAPLLGLSGGSFVGGLIEVVVSLEGGASSSSQSQSSIADSGYSCLLPAKLSWLGLCFSSSRSGLFLGKWSVVEIMTSTAIVSAVARGSGIFTVWFVQAQHWHSNIFCQASFFVCQYRVRISVSFSMSCLARKIPIGSIAVSSWWSMAATWRLAFQWTSQQVWLANCPTPSIALCRFSCLRSVGLMRSWRSRAASWGGTRWWWLLLLLSKVV